MKFVVFSVVCVALPLLASESAYAQIYKYVDSVTGAVEYTNQPKTGASRMNSPNELSETSPGNKPNRGATVKVSTSSNLNSGSAAASVDSGTQRSRDSTRRQVLVEELATEEKMLNDARSSHNNGKPQPMADEGLGSPKYIDRSKQLEKTLRHHERNVASLKQELSNIRM